MSPTQVSQVLLEHSRFLEVVVVGFCLLFQSHCPSLEAPSVPLKLRGQHQKDILPIQVEFGAELR